jgi:hypothetical protein
MVKVDVGNVYLDGKNVLKERSGNDDGGRERHVGVGGRQRQRVSQAANTTWS